MQTHPDLTESQQPQLYAAYISTYLLALFAVSLRLLSRTRYSRAGLWLDDFAICASLLVAGGNFVDMLICKVDVLPRARDLLTAIRGRSRGGKAYPGPWRRRDKALLHQPLRLRDILHDNVMLHEVLHLAVLPPSF